MRDAQTEHAYFLLRERASLQAARLSDDDCGEIVHRKLAEAYASKSRQFLLKPAASHD